MDFHHVSVLCSATVKAVLGPTNGVYVDCTLGGGGHAATLGMLLDNEAWLIGLDQDKEALKAARTRLDKTVSCHVTCVQRNFREVKAALYELGVDAVDGIIFDLGVSSYQLDMPERGFSYMHDGPLDMRMNQENKKTAADIVNTYREEELYRIIKDYGEERWAKRIAMFIVAARKEKKFTRTQELVQVIKQAIPAGARKDGPHPAKRTFQAIRIEVNGELSILQQSLEAAVSCLKRGGKIGVITFHSLEDRITKRTFKQLATECICPPHMPVCTCDHHASLKITNKVIIPSPEEIMHNPRARSAKLRIGVRI
ncbi:16S rRNA (cytosine(1402)-N(4))-methyltransferase [Veillonellaceae bacterium M2-4]|nr:16S rRNA (cytosine(1402)-N(4))-methyltransferase [Veillonellaceae bacterium M2-4]